jgi:hypothetical protein
MGTLGAIISMSNKIDSLLSQGTHCEGGRIDVQLIFATYVVQLRNGEIHKPEGIEKRNNVIALKRPRSLASGACTEERISDCTAYALAVVGRVCISWPW